MVVKIDIDALKIFFLNQEQMKLKIGKKLKTASLNFRVTGSKKKNCTSTCSLLKILKPIVAVNLKESQPTTSRALPVNEKIVVW